ncbi:carboxylesterase family protein [Hymenobacter sp. RP-2-7]|uniref:Carboxylesterase family protein n=1 Tax=Hymenobacter polaris TaxID=2682546 RepID=A0A7Y0FMZ5_9BACT|nr:carboxylesterase family protein [Hymenobacter polaris]NML65939.1 carboxylesterase family protein [Hymenobacter polaris]
MKYLYLWLLLALPTLGRAQTAGLDTTRGRYYQPVFASASVTRDVAYGSATTYAGATQTLLMDVYQPAGDTVQRRPLIIFAHGGGFIAGTKADAYPVAFCTRLARLGYVVASIEYRLGYAATGFGAAADTAKIAAAALRGGFDMKAAVRYFRQDAAGPKTYRIQPSYVVAAGSSAGAFAALETGYLDKASEVPSYLDLAALGGIEGNSGSPGYSSAVAAVINLSGATESPSIIEAGNAPLCSAHGTADTTVPYFQGRIGSLLPPKYVYGSGRLNPRAASLGITNVLRRFSKAGHVPFEASQAYADTVFWTVRDFLRPLLKRSGVALAARAAAAPAVFQAYPNPAREVVQLALPADFAHLGEAELLDVTGRVVRRFRPQAPTEQLPRGGLPAGLYALRFAGQAPVRVVFE